MLSRTFIDDDTTIIIMSDHGFESGNAARNRKKSKYFADATFDHRQFGMFVAAGPNIKSNEKVFVL